MPTTRETGFESPMNSACSPKRWRLSTNHMKTMISAVHSDWIGSRCIQSTLEEDKGRPTSVRHTVESSAPRKA